MAKTGAKKKKEKKEEKKTRGQYSASKLRQAMKYVLEDGWSQSKAARHSGIPRTTLCDKLSGKSELNCKPGPDPFLPAKIEEAVVDYLKDGIARGFPLNIKQLQMIVQNIVEDENLSSPFLNGKPGRSWCESFFKRHPGFCRKKSERHSRGRAAVTEEAIRRWFEGLKKYLEEQHLENLIDNPEVWYNFSETSCSVICAKGRYIGIKGLPLQAYNANSDRGSYTTSVCFSASGDMAPLQLILKLKRASKELMNSIPDNVVLSLSDSGWQTGDSFLHYLKKFHVYLVSLGLLNSDNNNKKIILTVDNHKSHEDYEVFKFCESVGIILYGLFPNSTHVLQPCNVAIMEPFEGHWKEEIHNHEEFTNRRSVTKVDLGPMLGRAIKKISEADMKTAFSCTGLVPFNPDAVHYKNLLSRQISKPRKVDEEKKKLFDVFCFHIPATTLSDFEEQFETQPSVWNGPERSRDLYDVWSKMKNDIYVDENSLDKGKTDALHPPMQIEMVSSVVQALQPSMQTEVMNSEISHDASSESDSEDYNEWQCMYCQRTYNKDKFNIPWLKCDSCPNTMHVRCIPSIYKRETNLLKNMKSGKEFEFNCTNCS